MGWKIAIAWDLAAVGIVLLVTLDALSVEYVRPLVTADSIAADIAPKFGVPEARLREELTNTMDKGWQRRLLVRGVPMCFVVALLAGPCCWTA
jgi:hypothetical protein